MIKKFLQLLTKVVLCGILYIENREGKFMESKYCKQCKFYNVGCHPIIKERKYKKFKNGIPDCIKSYGKAIQLEMDFLNIGG